MGDSVEDYKKAILPHIANWGKQNEPLGKQLSDLNKQIGELEKNKAPTPDQKKKLDDLKKQRQAVTADINKALFSFQQNLDKVPLPHSNALTGTPPQKPDPKLLELPKWMNAIVKEKGIPLGGGVTVKPNLDIDFKKMKLKSGGVTLQFRF
ncbi:MAG TPA: hypothetical protein VMB03_18315 [Bryobacteraceae bacterium]|nr:hypothetical protein [Bryobacteraceae bacterium]